MFALLLALPLFAAEPEKESASQAVKKSHLLRVGVCGGISHCPLYGVEILNPQTYGSHVGSRVSVNDKGAGFGLIYFFDSTDKKFDSYLDLSTLYKWTDDGFTLGMNYGSVIQIGNSPVFIDPSIGLAYLFTPNQSVLSPLFGLSISYGL